MAEEAPNLLDLQATVGRLTALAGGVRKALGLGDDADDAAVLAALGNATKERDDATARISTLTAERNTERIDAAVTTALGKSGILTQNTEDASAILRGALEVNDKGEVRTKAAPNVVPGQTAEQFIMGQLRTLRPHYWPLSAGGGAKGAGGTTHAGPDISCFRTGNLTDQMALIGRAGEKAVIDALRRSGIAPPPWLTKGVR